MVAEIVKIEPRFDAAERYAEYLHRQGESARRIREAAAAAAVIRIHIEGLGGENEYMPLTAEETKAVRQILSGLQEPPPHAFGLWLELKHDSCFGPQPAHPSIWSEMEFVAADGQVLGTFSGYGEDMGDAARAEEYRVAHYRPSYLLPAADVACWKQLPFHKRADERLHALYEQLRKRARQQRDIL